MKVGFSYACLLSLFLLMGASYGGRARIVAIEAIDDGSLDGTATASVDVVQTTCDDTTDEPFFDTLLRIKVQNDSSSIIKFNKVSFSIPNPYGTGGRLNTKKFALVGSGEVQPDGEVTGLLALFLDVNGAGKSYAGQTALIPNGLGFRNVTVRLYGKKNGRSVVHTARTTISFDDFDRC